MSFDPGREYWRTIKYCAREAILDYIDEIEERCLARQRAESILALRASKREGVSLRDLCRGRLTAKGRVGRDGNETRAIREERSAKLAGLYESEMLGREPGLISVSMLGGRLQSDEVTIIMSQLIVVYLFFNSHIGVLQQYISCRPLIYTKIKQPFLSQPLVRSFHVLDIATQLSSSGLQ